MASQLAEESVELASHRAEGWIALGAAQYRAGQWNAAAGSLEKAGAISDEPRITQRLFLALAYFGTDQSQVQRYLTASSLKQSRLSLIFNAFMKVPMQFFILSIGVLLFGVVVIWFAYAAKLD